MWEIASREQPFHHMAFEWIQDVKDAVCSGTRPQVPSTMPKQYKDLMTDCWAGMPTDRPSFSEIIQRLESIRENDETVSETSA